MAELDLVCGPSDPLPESAQSFRLIERLGSGGQADVYKAVRLSGGVSSAPVSVKVFRPEKGRPLEDQFRSWDKGDAVLMDLLGRGVPGICRRIDAFYGPPPHRPTAAPAKHRVPYQVLEYLPGKDLRELLPIQQRPRIDAVKVLRTIADVLEAMHRPNSPEIHPALHMDLKPANVIISPSGEAKVIDFTGSRYSVPTHMTTISYTPQAAGPEARAGRVGPSYDVHGFASVAFFLVTGIQPRGDMTMPVEGQPAGLAELRRHPVVEADPRLRAHLMAPLSDSPRDRPSTAELPRWIDELAVIMRVSRAPSLGVDWDGEAAASTMRMPSQVRHTEPATLPNMLATAELSTTQRIGGQRSGAVTATASVSPAPAPGAGQFGRGVAHPTRTQRRVVEDEEPPAPPAPEPPPEPKRPWFGSDGKLHQLSVGSQLSVVGALFLFVCWGIWALSATGPLGVKVVYLVFVLVVAVGVFAMARLLGTFLLVRMLNRTRRSARLSHLAAGVFLVIIGFDFLRKVEWIMTAWNWVADLF